MTREELLNGYKEDVRDFAKECVHFDGELDAAFFDNWAEHFTNLAERLRPSLPDGLEEAAFEHLRTKYKHSCIMDEDDKAVIEDFIAGAEWQKEQDQPITGNSLEQEWLRYVDRKKKEYEGELPSLGDYGWLQIARHFAEWQKKQDQQLIELAEDHAMLAGMNKMKEQMMKSAVEGRVIKSYNPVTAIGQPTLHGIELIYPDKGKPYLVAGDKVKMIVIAEEE